MDKCWSRILIMCGVCLWDMLGEIFPRFSNCSHVNLPRADTPLTSVSKIAPSPLLWLCPLTKLWDATGLSAASSSHVESPVNISSLNTPATAKAAAAAAAVAAAIQSNPNESGSPRFVHPGWRVMTALLCWSAYLLSVVAGCTGLVLSGLSLLGDWRVCGK